MPCCTRRRLPMLLAALLAAGCDGGRPGATAAAPAAAPGARSPSSAAPPAAQGASVTHVQSPGAEPSPTPDVPPVQHKGVRYQQDTTAQPPAGRGPGGTLAAHDAASGQRLWVLQVYTVHDDPGAPMPHPGRYFRSMVVVPGSDELEIENEAGGIYRVDLQTRQVRQVGGPPETAEAPAPARPKPKPTP